MPDLTITGNIQVDGVAYQNGVVIAGSLWAEGDPSEFTVLGETTSDVSGNWTLTLVGRTAPVAVLVQVPSDRPKVFAPVFDGYDLDWDFDGAAPPAPEPPPEPPPDPEPPEPPPVPGIPEPLPVDMWTPEFTQGPCWLHDEGSHVIVENKISAWLNRRPGSSTVVYSSQERTQTDPAKRPTWDYLNLRPVVVFDGVDDVLPVYPLFPLVSGIGWGHDRMTYYVVIKHATVPATKKVAVATGAQVTWTNPALGNYEDFLLGAGAPANKFFADYYAGAAEVTPTSTSTAADATTAWTIRAVAVDRYAGELRHYHNGAADPDATALPDGILTDYNALAELFLGATREETNHADVSIAELLVVFNEETRDHHRRIEGYLAWKWGLQANLPADHPYKAAYPVIPASWDYSAGTKDLWYDAADESTVILDGDSNVQEWRDKSGLGKHLSQSNAALRPSWDQFTKKIGIANDRFLSGSGSIGFADTEEYTLYIVTDIPNVQRSNLNVIFSALRTEGTVVDQNRTYLYAGYYEVYGEGRPNFRYQQQTVIPNGSGGLGSHGNGEMVGRPAVTVWTAVPAPPEDADVSVEIRAGYGTFHSTVNGLGSSNIGVVFWGGGQFGRITVGGYGRAADGMIAPMLGEVMEIIAFPVHHTSDQRQRVEGSLAWKWGVVEHLSQDHPYRWAPPYQEDVDAHTDANYGNVSLLLNFNDPSYASKAPRIGTSHFIDASPDHITVQRFRTSIINDYKNYTVGIRQPAFLGGSSSSYLATVGSPGFAFGTAPFTIEFRTQGHVSSSTRLAIVGNAAEGTANTGWEVGVNSQGGFYFRTLNTVLAEATSLAGFKLRGWVHFAVTFDGTTYRIFHHGKLAASSTTVVNLSSQLSVWIGRSRGATGYGASPSMRYLRITKGIARYTADFDPPTGPYPDTGP